VFEEVLPADFVLRGAPDVPRDAWIANAARLCWGDRYELTDFRLIAHDRPTAVVSFVLTTFRDPETCDRAILRSLVTDVWRQDDGRWRLVLRHSGPAGGSLAQQFAREAALPLRWERAADLSLVSTGGNTSTRTLGMGGAVTWRPGAWRTEARASVVRSETEHVLTAESLTSDVRQSRTLSPQVELFGRGTYLTNEFAGIETRITVDGGLGWVVSAAGAHRLRVDAGVGYSRETRITSPTLTAALANFGGAYRWQVARATALTDEALLTASLDDRDDWRLSNTLAITTAMTRLLSIRVAHELRLVNLPVPGFERRDTVIAVALVAKF
jgi:putative salt-induced outer membrane protein YdiY